MMTARIHRTQIKYLIEKKKMFMVSREYKSAKEELLNLVVDTQCFRHLSTLNPSIQIAKDHANVFERKILLCPHDCLAHIEPNLAISVLHYLSNI